ncbi:MAG TPA: hypothetical protein VHA56_13940 [Mucilaginibacter sp.]|nr:hypothetical protein [Mucilaginibacter sp.]
MNSRIEYRGTYLEALRERVINSYLRNRKLENKDDIAIRYPNNIRSKYYKAFRDDIFNITKVLLSPATIFSLLYCKYKSNIDEFIERPDQTFETFTIETFEKYANTIQTAEGLVIEDIESSNVLGAQLIDSAFKIKMQSDKFIPNKSDFYLAKKDNDCQWRGVVRNWDYPRETLDIVKEYILKCFDRESRIAAVIHGPGGSGKSIFLRRLAIQCINKDFKILWVDDFQKFCETDLETIKNIFSVNYLVILEDWHFVKSNGPLINTFINKIINIYNVRVVIGDRSPIEEKEYYHYLSEDGDFRLLPNENQKIIKRILELNNVWKESTEKIVHLPEFYNAPLYIILFVIARTSKDAISVKSKDILSRFREIIIDDLSKISALYPGLSLALYYWSCILIEYRINISWNAFLKIADHYNGNGDSFVSTRLARFELNTPVHQLLFQYISLKGFVNPDLDGLYTIAFHHDLLAETLSKYVRKDWHTFDYNIKCEIAEVLSKNNMKNSTRDFLRVLYHDKDFTDSDSEHFQPVYYDEYDYNGLGYLRYYDSLLKKYYEDAKKNMDDKYWIEVLIRTFYIHPFSEKSHLIIVKNIIDNGCSSQYVLKVYQHMTEDNLYEVDKLLDSLVSLIGWKGKQSSGRKGNPTYENRIPYMY